MTWCYLTIAAIRWQQCCLLKRLSNSLFCMEFTMLPFGKMENFWSYVSEDIKKTIVLCVFLSMFSSGVQSRHFLNMIFWTFSLNPIQHRVAQKWPKVAIFSLHRKTAPKPWWRWSPEDFSELWSTLNGRNWRPVPIGKLLSCKTCWYLAVDQVKCQQHSGAFTFAHQVFGGGSKCVQHVVFTSVFT